MLSKIDDAVSTASFSNIDLLKKLLINLDFLLGFHFTIRIKLLIILNLTLFK